MKKGWNSIRIAVLTGLLALTAALSACGEGTVTEAVGVEATETPQKPSERTPTLIPTIDTTSQAWSETWNAEKTATQSDYETLIAPYPRSCSENRHYEPSFLISPDENWLAAGCSYEKFFVSNRDGARYWEIPLKVPSYDDPTFFSSFSNANPVQWSNESRYLYFHLHHVYEPSFVSPHWYDIDPIPNELFVMDTSTGEWHALTPAANLFSFSPTGRRLLFISVDYFQFENIASFIDITVLDLQTGEEVKYSLTDYLVADYVVWSEDGTQAFFSAERGLPVYFSEDPHTYSIYRIDMLSQTMSMVYTFPDSENIIYTADYMDDENLLVLNSENHTTDTIETLYLDPNTGELFEEPPTP